MNLNNNNKVSIVNTIVGNNNHDIQFYAFDPAINEEIKNLRAKNRSLEQLLLRAVNQLKTKDQIIEILLEYE